VLSLALLAGKFLFLVVLYLFVFMVVRSGARGLKPGLEPQASAASASVSTVALASSLVEQGADVEVRQKAWALLVEASPTLREGTAVTLLPGERMVLGRAPESDVVLNDTFVSSRHAAVEAVAEGLLVEDLGSTNGTFVDGTEVEGRLFVSAGEKVAIGDTVFMVEER
jgi:hypothetical protein